MGDPDLRSGLLCQPGPELAAKGFWGVNQQMEALSLCPSVFQINENFVTNMFRGGFFF